MSGTAEAQGTRIEFSRAFLRVRGTKTFLRRDLQRGLKLRLEIGAPCPIRSEFPPAPIFVLARTALSWQNTKEIHLSADLSFVAIP
jgi:hypothetical protein